MVWNTPYLGTPRGVTFTSSGGTTVLSDLSISGDLIAAGGTYSSTITTTDTDFLSVATAANSSGMTVGHLRLVFRASGLSLVYSSGESEYVLLASTTSADQS